MVILFAIMIALGTGASMQQSTGNAPVLFPFYDSTLHAWGYMDSSGVEQIHPRFCGASAFREGVGIVGISVTPKTWAFLHASGDCKTTFVADAVRSWKEGVCPAQMNGKWGYIGSDGKWIISPIYESSYEFTDGLGAVKAGTGWGFADKRGVIRIACRFNRVRWFSEELAVVQENAEGPWMFIDRIGKKQFDGKYDVALPFSEGLAAVCINGKWSFINKNGERVCGGDYTEARQFAEGCAEVRMGNKWGFIDQRGKVLYGWYKGTTRFSEGLASVQGDAGMWGYIDKKGDMAITMQFDAAEPFNNGLGQVTVSVGRKRAYIDKRGRIVREWDAPPIP
jgi:WG repeat protein